MEKAAIREPMGQISAFISWAGRVFQAVRAGRIYDRPKEMHKWSLPKKVKRDFLQGQAV